VGTRRSPAYVTLAGRRDVPSIPTPYIREMAPPKPLRKILSGLDLPLDDRMMVD
jgi:hypothetical protein